MGKRGGNEGNGQEVRARLQLSWTHIIKIQHQWDERVGVKRKAHLDRNDHQSDYARPITTTSVPPLLKSSFTKNTTPPLLAIGDAKLGWAEEWSSHYPPGKCMRPDVWCWGRG